MMKFMMSFKRIITTIRMKIIRCKYCERDNFLDIEKLCKYNQFDKENASRKTVSREAFLQRAGNGGSRYMQRSVENHFLAAD